MSPGERQLLEELDQYPLPDETFEPGYETEGDVVRLLMGQFDATLTAWSEPPRVAREDESPQLVLLRSAPRVLREGI